MKKEKSEINPYLINSRFLKPLDTELLNKLKDKVQKIITIEENSITGGFGSMIKSFYSNTDMKVLSFGLPENFVPHGETNKLKELIGLTPEHIFEIIKTELNL
ncbi:MAG: hypothetical protein H8E57_02560 [Candidatus Cloacimonetes bacterium]|nr:hypothetical protein [Candidatus Cloacimonadota bacterium]